MIDIIDITGVNLVEFAKKVYELSTPQGLGFLHYTPEPLTDEEVKELVQEKGNIALDMDYVRGRACKMIVWRSKDGRLEISDPWYDHTDRIFDELLRSFNLVRGVAEKHGISCACIDCQSQMEQQ